MGNLIINQDIQELTRSNVYVKVNDAENYDNLQYSFDGIIWKAYDIDGVEMTNNGTIYFKNNDNIVKHYVGNIDKIGPDKVVVIANPNATNDKVDIKLVPDSDAYGIQYSYDGNTWYDYKQQVGKDTIINDFPVSENCTIYFKEVDKLGNETISTFVVNNIDTTADRKDADYVFISNRFSKKTTGTTLHNIDLTYEKNAFKFVSNAGDIIDKNVIVTDSKVSGNPYKGCKKVYSSAVQPVIVEKEKYYSYKANAISQNTLEITKDTSYTEFHRFANVNITGKNEDKTKITANSFFGGKIANTETRSNSESKTSNTNTVKTVYSDTATGKFTAKHADVERIQDYATVTLQNSDIDEIIANNINNSASTKVVNSQTKDQRTLSASTKEQTTGKVTLNDSIVGTIYGYTNVTLTNSEAGAINNSSFSSSQSDSTTYDHSKQTVTRKLSFTTTKSTTGTLTAKNSTLTGSVNGFATVSLINVNVDDNNKSYSNFNRELYSTVKETVTVKTDKAGIITENYSLEEKYNRAGKLTAKNSQIGNVTNFNTVLLENSDAGDITNSTLEKKTATDSVAYLAMDKYGTPEDYRFNMDIESLEGITKESLSGTVTLKNSSAASVRNFKTLTLESSDIALVANVEKVNINKGRNTITDFIGATTSSISQLTIAKNAILELNSLDYNLESKTKVVLNGTLILTSDQINSDTIITGKGEIAANNDIYTNLEVNYLHLINTGATSDGFSGTVTEQADNSINKAVKWDGTEPYEGWLGYWTGYKEGFDKVDYIKFTAQDGDTLSINIDNYANNDLTWHLYKGGKDEITDLTDLAAGDYILKLEHTNAINSNSTSLSYSIELNNN